jgi:uncharacterized protein (TIGR00369 family)
MSSTLPTAGQLHAAAAAAIADSPTRPSRDCAVVPERLAGAPGVERLRANLDGTIPPPPAWYALGYRLTAVEHGRVDFAMEPLPGHTNYGGTVHGGVISALADSAMACAVLSVLDADHWCATIELKVNMLRPVAAPGDLLLATGTVRWRGGTTAVAEATLRVGDREVAIGTSTHVIRPSRRLAGGPVAGDAG